MSSSCDCYRCGPSHLSVWRDLRNGLAVGLFWAALAAAVGFSLWLLSTRPAELFP